MFVVGIAVFFTLFCISFMASEIGHYVMVDTYDNKDKWFGGMLLILALQLVFMIIAAWSWAVAIDEILNVLTTIE